MNEPAHTSRSQGQPGYRKKPFRALWLPIARVGWLGIAGTCVFLLAIAAPVRYAQLANPPTQVRAGLLALGLPLEVYVYSNLVLDSCVVLVFFITAVLLFWRRSDEWFPLLVASLLVTFGTDGPTIVTLQEVNPAWSPLTGLIDTMSWGLLGFFLSLFPDGRFVPRWSRWYSIVMAVYALLWNLPMLPAAFHPSNWHPLLFIPLQLGPFALFLGFQIYRYRYVSGPVQRQQTKWMLFGLAVALCTIPFLTLSITPSRTTATIFGLFVIPALRLLWLFIPLSLSIAILRYRLWDIDLIINRTLVYSSLTASIVGLYTLVVGALGTLLQAQGAFLDSLLAAGLIAVLFHPLRDLLQRLVNRLMFGDRDTPYQAISRLGQRLEATLASDAALPTIVETVAHALKLPYTAITLKQEEGWSTAASFGAAQGSLVHLPLLYQGEPVGELLLAPRSPGEAFSSADRKLLEDLSRQAGMAVHTVALSRELERLTQDLRSSRTALVTAREEERRRLRRDIHDGLGSALASLNWRAGALRSALTHDLAAADALVAEQQVIIRSTIADIRRLVYNLRLPSLDELGLVGALRERVAHATMSTDNGQVAKLHVTVEAVEDLPPLPAAIEVAAYRIVQEALTNVVRHAHASTCQVRLSVVEGTLYVEVTDDGVGIAIGQQAGVGLLSMRERAAEVGGSCHIRPRPRGGTQVCASLPLLID